MYSSSTTWKLVPPNPNALTAAVRGRRNGDPMRLQLKFARGKDRTYLVEGAELLELAARVLAGERPGR